MTFQTIIQEAVAKDQFWYLDVDKTTVTDGNASNTGMRERALLSNGGKIIETKIPLNRYAFFENLSENFTTNET